MSLAARDGLLPELGLAPHRDQEPERRSENQNQDRSSEDEDEDEEEEEEEKKTRRTNKTTFSIRGRTRQTRDGESDESDDDDDDTTYRGNMAGGNSRSKYHVNIPSSSTYDANANTGPKGVIADAQAYERARKNSRRKTFLSGLGGWVNKSSGMRATSPEGDEDVFSEKVHERTSEDEGAGDDDDDGDDDKEEAFMAKWRAARMQELKQQGGRPGTPNGAGRHQQQGGTLQRVDADGFLDAIETPNQQQIVAVCIYDPDSYESSLVEDCLRTIAQTTPPAVTRFVKLHHRIADLQHVSVPAILAYRGGDVFATIDDVFAHIPDGRSCSASSLAELLKLYQIL